MDTPVSRTNPIDPRPVVSLPGATDARAVPAPADLAALLAALGALVAAHAATVTSPAARALLDVLRAVLSLGSTYALAPSWWSFSMRHNASAVSVDALVIGGDSLSVSLDTPPGHTGLEHPDTVPAPLRAAQARTRAYVLRFVARHHDAPPADLDVEKNRVTPEELRAAGFGAARRAPRPAHVANDNAAR